METLEFYLKNARHAILLFGNRNMSKDEDSISHVAYEMMHADEKYDGVTGSREGFRWECGRFAVMSLLSKQKRKNKFKTVSIDKALTDDGFSISDVLTRDKKRSEKNNERVSDIFDIVDDANYLTDREKECLHNKYDKNMTLEEIGASWGTTREYVRQVAEKAIYKIRKTYECDSKDRCSIV